MNSDVKMVAYTR